eukprot:SAG31_NODE_2313_length_5956_cov_3.390302_6_plen_82_part_00
MTAPKEPGGVQPEVASVSRASAEALCGLLLLVPASLVPAEVTPKLGLVGTGGRTRAWCAWFAVLYHVAALCADGDQIELLR